MFKANKKNVSCPKRSHIKNLIALAQADGHFAEIEEHLLIEIAHRIGMSNEEIIDIRDGIDTIEFVIPDKYEERIEQFQDLLSLVSVDGHIDETEVEMCKSLAEKFEIPLDIVDKMLAVYA